MTSEAANDETIQVLDAIGDVHIALIDAVHGYDVLLEKAEPDIENVLRTTRQTTDAQAQDLARFLTGQGRHPSQDESLLSAVHEGMIRTKSFFTDIDGDVLPAVAEGERRLVTCYDDALETLAKNMQHLPPDTSDAAHTLLLGHRSEIEDVVRRLYVRHSELES
tara:strand:- start:5526 stop:6017 length:492 start_codon:yes stop_codon:yes gene_type:complete